MHGIIGSVGLLMFAAGIAVGGISLVTSYWQERGDEHRGFWMECLRVQERIQCVSNIEGDVAKHRYAGNHWYKAIVCCHAFGVVTGFLAALLTLWCICGSDDKSTKTFLAVTMGVISCCLYISSVTMWKTQWTIDDNFKDGWSFFLGITGAAVTGIAASITTVGAYIK